MVLDLKDLKQCISCSINRCHINACFFYRLTRSKILTLPAGEEGITVENWTKWQVYVRQSPDEKPVTVYARTGDTVAFQNKVCIPSSIMILICKIHMNHFKYRL